ncbi:hypothetical protein QE109_12870 [Fusibacter bizertensis]|uniref:Lipoprotein n=1 Tax=Fusibacter bizertensis TaxID=1488331 RepID=A0ABT6NFA4_9FIRM|nr:hypothetical protein [Fusibacter bizertensis]MDH8679045.1 hypothetical protein [Fusibacter bizertensis]
MKKLLILFIVLFFLGGCAKNIEPYEVIENDFDLDEAMIILEKTWEPIKAMTDSKFVTKPRVEIPSREEFFNIYKFTYMNDLIKNDIYESLVVTDSNGKEVKDPNGIILFDKGEYEVYIPTIYDEGVIIERAYLKESKYKEEYSYLDKIELIIEEKSNETITNYASGFYRTNIFRKNENDEWVLTETKGVMLYSWERGKK